MRTEKQAITAAKAIIRVLQTIYEITDVRNEFSILEELKGNYVSIEIQVDFD